jgi:hypothetical protein
MKINIFFSENTNWRPPSPKVKILDQKLDLSYVKPSVDSGFIYEEHIVPVDYEVKATPRYSSMYREHLDTARKSTRSRQTNVSN